MKNMKNMKKFFPVRACGLTMFFLAAFSFFFSFPAGAEPERYDFLQLTPREESAPFASALTSAKPAALRGEEANASKTDEAKRKAIAALFRRHNKKLKDAQARDYANYILQACEKFNQDPLVIAALVVNESSARAEVVSRGGDYGLMQVRWRVHQKTIREKYPHIAKAKDMLNPENNVLVGTEIFSDCHERADHSVDGAVMNYSAGNERLARKVLAELSRLERSYREYLKKG